MPDIALVASEIAPIYIDPGMDEVFNIPLAETITTGQAVALNATGQGIVADGNGADLRDEPQAVALQSGLAGMVISVLRRGWCEGFTVGAINTGVVVCLSNTAGAFETGGASTIYCGRVVGLPDGTRVIYFDFYVRADYS